MQCRFEIYGFLYALQDAYGACIFIRLIAHDGSIAVTLYMSKSRVAPLYATTIPRLELCGTLLLTEFINDVQLELKQLNIACNISNVYL